MSWLRFAALLVFLHAVPSAALEPFVIKDIRIEGIQRTEAGTVFSYLPVKVGDEVSVYCGLLGVGRSSMTIEVEAWRRHRDGDETIKVTEAVFTFVAIDDQGKPRPIVQE